MEENLIKSKQRVQKHGEVFTPAWMVQKMLDTPGVKEACESVYKTFLEPSAGDGNFLQAILERKLKAVVRQYDKRNWKTKSLGDGVGIWNLILQNQLSMLELN